MKLRHKVALSVRELENEHDAREALTKLDFLLIKREAWQITFDNSSAELLELLAGCYDTFHLIKGKKRIEKDFLVQARTNIQMRTGKKVSNSSVMSLIVLYVFQKNGRRIEEYTRTLKSAYADKIAAGGFIDWVSCFGELEDAFYQRGVTEETKRKRDILEEKVQSIPDYLEELLENPVAIVRKNPLPLEENDNEYSLLIGKTDSKGVTRVITVIPNSTDGMIGASMKKIAESLIKHEGGLVKQKKKSVLDDASAKALAKATNIRTLIKAA